MCPPARSGWRRSGRSNTIPSRGLFARTGGGVRPAGTTGARHHWNNVSGSTAAGHARTPSWRASTSGSANAIRSPERAGECAGARAPDHEHVGRPSTTAARRGDGPPARASAPGRAATIQPSAVGGAARRLLRVAGQRHGQRQPRAGVRPRRPRAPRRKHDDKLRATGRNAARIRAREYGSATPAGAVSPGPRRAVLGAVRPRRGAPQAQQLERPRVLLGLARGRRDRRSRPSRATCRGRTGTCRGTCRPARSRAGCRRTRTGRSCAASPAPRPCRGSCRCAACAGSDDPHRAGRDRPDDAVGVRLRRRWKRLTARSVPAPKMPSTGRTRTRRWILATVEPRMPRLM